MQRGPKIMEPAVYRTIPGGGGGGSHYHRSPPPIPLSLGIGRSHRVNVSTLRETVQRYISSLNSKFNVNMFDWKPADIKHAKFLIFVSASVHACFNTCMHMWPSTPGRGGGAFFEYGTSRNSKPCSKRRFGINQGTRWSLRTRKQVHNKSWHCPYNFLPVYLKIFFCAYLERIIFGHPPLA
jgi:hypothetical protein